MAVYVKENYYGLILKTNLYTGNFERQLTAYCTGRVGECEVGKEIVPMFAADMKIGDDDWETEADPFWDAISYIPDEHGCVRPVSLWYKDSKSLVIFFEEKPTKEQIDIIKERSAKYATDERILLRNRWDAQPDLKIEDVRVVHIKTTIEDVNP